MAVDLIWRDGGCICLGASMVVPIAPEVAFDYVADLTRHPEWSAHRMRISAVAGDVPRAGSKYRAVARQLGREWASAVTVTSYERPSRFEFAAAGGITRDPSDDPFRHLFSFTTVPGGTRIELLSRSRQRSPALLQPLLTLATKLPRPLLDRTPMAKSVRNLERCLRDLAVTGAAS